MHIERAVFRAEAGGDALQNVVVRAAFARRIDELGPTWKCWWPPPE
jgi:hypothetical protein